MIRRASSHWWIAVGAFALACGCSPAPAPTPASGVAATSDAGPRATTPGSPAEVSRYLLEPRDLEERRSRALTGDAAAQMAVELHYMEGRPDDREYVAWLVQFVRSGDPFAMQRLATYLELRGGQRNCSAAIRLFESAARRGVELKLEASVVDSFHLSARRNRGEIEGFPACAERPEVHRNLFGASLRPGR
jgi:hypothetical protein